MNKVALITGGSSGLGFAMAKSFQARGYDLILLARNADKLQNAKETLIKIDPTRKIHLFPCDVSNEEHLAKTFAEIRGKFVTINFLVLNAGIATINLLSDYKSLGELSQNIKINLLGVVSTTYLSLPLLKSGGHILFISSGFGLIGPAGYSLYATAKAGVSNFADAMRREMLSRNVTVHVTCPGDIDTPMLQGELDTMPDWMAEKMGRAKPKSPDAVAKYILNKCFKGRFMIYPSSDVVLLVMVQKLLPRFVTNYIIDKILPLPPKSSSSHYAINADRSQL